MQEQVLSKGRFDVYDHITTKIADAIEAGAGEFVMPWHRIAAEVGRPTNALTRMKYSGVNVITLWTEGLTAGYNSGWWATFEQWKKLGAQIRRGEHGATIVFYKQLPRDDVDDAAKRPPVFARASRVFSADQVVGWEPPERAKGDLTETLEQVETFVRLTRAEIRHGGAVACYRPKADAIDMPDRGRFVGTTTSTPTESYYAVLLHELTHWSGAEHRLNRQLGERFGSDAYAMEELVAELGAAFLCADLEVANDPRPDHAAYVGEWLTVLRSDRRAIFTAARRAQEAAAYLGSFVEEVPSG